jgi:predicted neuraminidase
MPVVFRVLLIVALWVLCWAVSRSMPHDAKPGFADAPPPPDHSAAPFFRTETINPEQGLPMVHVAALAQTPDGILHCVWYGGTAECRPDVNIYLAHKEPGGRWTEPVAILTRKQAEQDLGRPVQALGNALLIAERDGSLRLLFVTIAMGKWSGSQLNSCVSKDGGLSWSKAEHLTLSPLFNLSELVRNRPVPLRDGGWCVPIYQEFLGKFPELLWLGKDGSYRKTRIAGGCSVFQPSLVPTGEGSAVVLLRDYTRARKIQSSRSADGGKKWSVATPTTLPNPDAGISALPLRDGRILLAYNDSPKDRSDLSLALSGNGGTTWSKLASLQHEEGAAFAYPYLFRSADGLILLAYTWKGRELRLITFNEAWVNDQAARSGKP